ncbi:Bacteriophage T7 tail fibre protein [uncultured Caudovirales phage]|uniref:Bacteriophage T7 tail fibre protein n=1 Tax=uncultured Caudovirales phage TaxID=2100421 RepID=A0A6J5KLC3_9CAUD|nr:Bacteriophage T7 tail fibre protein [uncultured Caudovirales phage]
MAVNTSTNKISYTGDGTTTVFAYNFKILDATHLNVYLAGVLQTSGYSVTGVGADAGGGVVFGTAPGSGTTVLLQRIVPLTQPVSTVDNATILSSVLDTALDRVTMQTQQNSADIAGSIKTPAADPALDMTLPVQAARANKYFYFDANGKPTVISSQIVGYYYGSLAADPSTRPDGSARVAGDIYFSTSTLGLRVYTGSAWTAALPTAALTLGNFTEVAASAKTTFTITGGYSVGSTFVYLNGTLLYPTEYTASNGTTVVLGTACAIGDEFRCVSYSNFSVADTLSRASNLSDLPSATTALTNLGFSTFAQSLRGDADVATFRTSLGLDFGATAPVATQAQAVAGSDNTTVMTPLRSSQAIAALTTSATVGAATAGLAAGAVGSYLFGLPNNTTTYATGATIAGSVLLPVGAQSVDGAPATQRVAGTGSAQAGTWRCMGTRSTTSGVIDNCATLWLRIS